MPSTSVPLEIQKGVNSVRRSLQKQQDIYVSFLPDSLLMSHTKLFYVSTYYHTTRGSNLIFILNELKHTITESFHALPRSSTHSHTAKMIRLKPRSRTTSSFWDYVGFIFLISCILGVVASSSASPPPAQPSPSADVELICHTDDLSECYPKIFSPTNEFQVLHDDQDIPPGLHVRMNVWTGDKEAKLNIPDEQNTELEGLPVDKSVVIVDPDQPEEEEQIRIPAGAPVYEANGKIKEPPKSEESLNFHDSLEILRKGLDIDQALEDLEELSHDIYYGLKIAEDFETIKSLLCLANTDNIFSENPDPVDVRRARLAALTIAATLQNNAKAMKEVEKHWPALMQRNCAGFDDRLNAAQIISDQSTGDMALAKARASALNSLLKIDDIRKHVVKLGGMGQLLEVLVSNMGEEWEPAKRRVAQLVQDNFLDADMGAKLGLWPVDDQNSDKECWGFSETELTSRPSCWDYAAKRLSEENKKDKGHWSHELWKQLKEARKGVPSSQREKTEL